MATYVSTKAERNRLMSNYPLVAKIVRVDLEADDFQLVIKESGPEEESQVKPNVAGYKPGQWYQLSVSASQIAFA